MARNQQWEINKWPLRNIGPLVKTHIHSRAATVHMSTHSLPISSALFAKTLLSNEAEGLQSHRARQSSVIPECCFPSGQPGPLSKVILTNQDSLQHQIYEWTAHCKRNPQLTHNYPGEEIGLPGTPLWTKLDCQYGPQTFEKSRKTMEQKINTPKPQWWLHLVN